MANFKLNNINYDIDDGVVGKDKHTEELDSYIVTLPFQDKLDITAFDEVEINDDRFGNKIMLVDTWVDDIASFNPLKYTYTINLVSETLKLQKVVLPSLSVTQPLSSTKKTIYGEIKRVFDLYIKKQYPELSLSNNIVNITDNCAEILTKKPTAFEFINELLSQVNYIVTIKNHIIDIIDLSKYGNEIDVSKINFENESQQASDYANRLDIQVDNAISSNDNAYTVDFITMRASDNQVLTTDNMCIKLPKPIYSIKKDFAVFCTFPIINNRDAQDVRMYCADISEFIVSKAEYDSYLIREYTTEEIFEHQDKYVIKEMGYKINALYFNEGGSEILGLGYTQKFFGLIHSYTALVNILWNCVPTGFVTYYNENDILDKVTFSIRYKTNDSFNLVLSKDSKNKATLIDNQTEAMVDIEKFGYAEQEKLNRLGNKVKIINAVYELDETIPQLSDYIDDYVLAEREIVYYKDYCLFKGYLYKDFIKKNMFYGLESKKRYTQISGQFVDRNEHINYTARFSLSDTEDDYKELERYLLTPLALSSYTDETIVYDDGDYYKDVPAICFVETYDKLNNRLSNLLLTSTSCYAGNSAIINFAFEDNLIAGYKSNEEVTGGILQRPVKYADDYGNVEKVKFDIRIKTDHLSFIEQDTDTDFKAYGDALPEVTDEFKENKGLINGSQHTLLNDELVVKKDNREKLGISFNINFKDSENIVIGNIAKFTGLAHHYRTIMNNVTPPVKIVYSITKEYEKGDRYGIQDIPYETTTNINPYYAELYFNNNQSRLYNFNSIEINRNTQSRYPVSSWKSWGIVDNKTGELILGVNKGSLSEVPTKIYLGIEKENY